MLSSSADSDDDRPLAEPIGFRPLAESILLGGLGLGDPWLGNPWLGNPWSPQASHEIQVVRERERERETERERERERERESFE